MSFCVAIGQINSKTGAFKKNAASIHNAAQATAPADLFVTSLGALSGIAPRAWRERAEFLVSEREALKSLLPSLTSPSIVATSSALIYVEKGQARLAVGGELLDVNQTPVGILIGTSGLQAEASDLKRRGAKALLVFGVEPFVKYEREKKVTFLKSIALGLSLPLIYVNPVGGNDGIVHEGGSFIYNAKGESVLSLPLFKEASGKADIETLQSLVEPKADTKGELYDALVLAIRDYVHKNGFTDIELGLSGGVDSALVAALAVDALGQDHVHALMMPTRFTSDRSLKDAEALAQNLGIDYAVRPIGALFDAYMENLKDDFAGKAWDATEENLQARIRGMLLMAHANKFNRLVLATSNKSEAAVGYSTLYGDTAGALEAIADIYKTEVWELCRVKNKRVGTALIPESILTRAPSAELREGQEDAQTLPPYDVLDKVIALYVEEKATLKAIVESGVDQNVATKIIRMIHRAEFKRSQIPTVVRVSAVPFGVKPWNFPLTASVP